MSPIKTVISTVPLGDLGTPLSSNQDVMDVCHWMTLLQRFSFVTAVYHIRSTESSQNEAHISEVRAEEIQWYDPLLTMMVLWMEYSPSVRQKPPSISLATLTGLRMK